MKIRTLSRLIIVLSLLILGWIVGNTVISGYDQASSTYGIDPKIFLVIIIISEILFDLGIVLMIIGSGVLKLGISDIIKFDFSAVHFSNKTVFLGFSANRVAAALPFLYLLLFGWGKLPKTVIFLTLVAIAIVIIIGIVPFYGRQSLKYD